MLLTLISTLLGAMSNILPAIVSLVQKKNDQAHEVEMAKLDMQKIDMQAKNQLAITNINADVGETNAIHAADASSSGDGFWSGVSASVRPVLTYVFFGLFVCVKVSALAVILSSGLSIIDAMPILWDENTVAIFGSIMGFYFGSRTLERFGFYARPNNNRVSTTVSQPTK
jgi:hypothetical protein